VFAWVDAIIRKGWKKPLVEEDLFDLDPRDTCEQVNPKWDRNWEKQAEKSKRSGGKKVRLTIAPTLVKTYGGIFLRGSAFALMSTLLQQVLICFHMKF
jgi:hypothetical protein